MTKLPFLITIIEQRLPVVQRPEQVYNSGYIKFSLLFLHLSFLMSMCDPIILEPSQVPLNRRTSGRQGGVHELSAFEQLVVELVRHDDSWPFMKLVSKIQVTNNFRVLK